MEILTKEATFSADVLVYVYETRGWVSVADKQRCTLSAKKWSSTSEGGVTHITAHTKDRRVSSACYVNCKISLTAVAHTGV